ncbi:Hypothetical predicted protein [Paramuricea clavata]|uniref:Uncharacterized protein n=1 Tax=Paramuricea clavata TaxID=317549 RepID=A0A6S7HQ94_PARCT|nr:Hypothetical predicted protein [Paramuricea clavata]
MVQFCNNSNNLMYVNDIQVAAVVLLSGNNFGKLKRLAACMNLAFVSKSSFFRIQRLYFVPAVDEWWGWMRRQLMDEFKDEEVIAGGDGQCDSPEEFVILSQKLAPGTSYMLKLWKNNMLAWYPVTWK